jgi:hypothetical protein
MNSLKHFMVNPLATRQLLRRRDHRIFHGKRILTISKEGFRSSRRMHHK